MTSENFKDLDFSLIEDKIDSKKRKQAERAERALERETKKQDKILTETPKPPKTQKQPTKIKREYTAEEILERAEAWRNIKNVIAVLCYLIPVVFWQPRTYDATGNDHISSIYYLFLVGMIIHWRFWLIFIGSMIATLWVDKFIKSFQHEK